MADVKGRGKCPFLSKPYKFSVMAELKNVHLLDGMDQKSLELMEHAAVDHRRFSSISFKVEDVSEKSVTIQVVQDKSAAGHYHSQKRLIEIVHETFDRFFTGKKIKVHAIPYVLPDCSVVDAGWISDKMAKLGIRLKDIANDTGLNYTQLSSSVNGGKPLSETSKAMFYYYFQAKQLEKKRR